MTETETVVADPFDEYELKRVAAEAKKAVFDARLSEIDVRRKELELIEEQINLDYQLSGTFSFNRRVDNKSMNALYRCMRIWHKYDPEGPWTILMNSCGGSAYSAGGIIDELISQSIRGGGTHEITIKVRGVAASAAGMILQAADHRLVGWNSRLMIHKGSGGITGTADDIADEHAWWEEATDQMVTLFLSRTNKITRAEVLRKINRKDWWLSAEEAVELGLADGLG
jgi:ATP-dependent protease ClpP protease subunit